ncbi:MAG: hypothetical protein IKG27_00120 [Bacilli bacterium]|nr:hypothetical protein [Bacilli bacterium]
MKKNIIIGVLILIIIILGGSIFYLNMNKDKVGCNCKETCQKTEDVKEKETEETAEKTQKTEFKYGKYEYVRPTQAGDYKDIIEFMEDGTYFEKISHTMGTIFYGTYKIDGQNITLNQTFRMNNEVAGGAKEEKTYTVKLEDDKIIKDDDNEKITLVKNNNAENIKDTFIKWILYSEEEYGKSLSNN